MNIMNTQKSNYEHNTKTTPVYTAPTPAPAPATPPTNGAVIADGERERVERSGHTRLEDWATAINTDLRPVSHILNGVVDDIVSLDTMIQGVPLGHGEEEPATRRMVATGTVSAHGQHELQGETERAYESGVGVGMGNCSPELRTYIQGLQQTSRNLRAKVQVIRVGPVRG